MSRPLNPWKLSGYKPGQNVVCRVTGAEPGGYAVLIPKDNLPGFLPTDANLRENEEILAQFVCVHNNRILLSARFSNTTGGKSPHQTNVNWEEQLQQDTNPASAPVAPSPAPSQAIILKDDNGARRQLPTHVQTPFAMEGQTPATTSEDAEAAFDVWAKAAPRKFHLKRATDLILPPMEVKEENSFYIRDYDLEWLLTDLEGGMRTGCVKASSESRLSRSALLLYKGRAVGCIYGCKTIPETQPTEQSLQLMLSDLERPDTLVRMYDLPESVTLAMSALFLGYPVQRNDDYDSVGYMNYIGSWFESKAQTACLAITLPASSATCLAFTYRGQFVGSFYVEDQNFSPDINFVHQLLKNDPDSNIEASILPPEMTSSAVRFGFSLSMAMQRNKANK